MPPCPMIRTLRFSSGRASSHWAKTTLEGQVAELEDDADERRDQTLDQGADDGRESGADDHGDGEFDDVPAEDEVAEALEHGQLLNKISQSGSTRRSGAGGP